MTFKDIAIGTKLEIEVMYPDENSTEKMVSQLEDVEDENTALIAAPMAEGIVHTIKSGTRINVSFLVKLDIYRIELYTFNAMALGIMLEDKIPLIRIRLLGEIGRLQRREYYRSECSLEIQFSFIEPEEEGGETSADVIKAITRNISGGGVCILLREKIPMRSIIKCIVTLGGKTIPFKGKVVRITPYEYQGVYNYEAGVSFIDIEDKDREEIIRFIFREQRRMRRKGLI